MLGKNHKGEKPSTAGRDVVPRLSPLHIALERSNEGIQQVGSQPMAIQEPATIAPRYCLNKSGSGRSEGVQDLPDRRSGPETENDLTAVPGLWCVDKGNSSPCRSGGPHAAGTARRRLADARIGESESEL